MSIDILNIQPSVISKDLRGKYVCIYGPEKVGKTTFGANLPRSLFCNFEIGTNFLSGIRAVNIKKWADFQVILRQLRNPEAKKIYDTIVIDTAGEAYRDCQNFIVNKEQVQDISDIPYGKGYGMVDSEFESAFREITMLGFGICWICHVKRKSIPGSNDTIIEAVSPDLPDRAAKIINRLADITAYIDLYKNEDGTLSRRFITRETPYIKAGSRLRYLEPIIPFSYKDLIDAIGKAVDKQEELDGDVVVEHQEKNYAQVEIPPFKKIREEAEKIWTELIGNGETEKQQLMFNTIQKKIENIFGHPIKLSSITEDQVDLFYLLLLDMRELKS